MRPDRWGALRRIVAMPRLWWRSKGFGIHSPSAYEYVRGVVNEKCHYYAYERVDALAKECGMSRRTARLLMRVALREQSREALCAGVPKQVESIVTAWSSEARVTENPGEECRLVVIGSGDVAHKGVLSAVERVGRTGGTIVLLGVNKRTGGSKMVLERVLGQGERQGVLMTDGRTAVVHVVPGVPEQSYEMRL